MESDYSITNQDIRGFNQMSLDTFIMDLDNSLESVVQPQIERLKEKRKELQSKNIDYEKHLKDSGRNELEVEWELITNGTQIEIHYLDQELNALCEMKIIYLYKFFEINIKKLIQGAYSIKSTKNLFRWDMIISFLLGEGIEAKHILGYTEIVQLKDVNNSLKHSSCIDDNLKNRIPEFSNIQFVGYIELENFHNRIKEFPKKFLELLSTIIYKQLYVFSDEKLNSIVYDLALRMESDDAEKLIQKLKDEYGLK